MNGWVKLHRKVLENPVWQKSNYVAVWVYLLLNANHEDKSIIWNNEKVCVERGCFIGSIKKISEHYGMSTSTVSYILDYFISESMIEKRSNKKFTYFKIKNWDLYQEVESKVENKQKTSRKQVETNKNDKNIKNNILYGVNAEENKIFDVFYKTVNPAINYGHGGNRKAAKWLIDKYGIDKAIQFTEYACKVQGQQYAPRITTPFQLKEKLAELKIYAEQQKSKSSIAVYKPD